MSNFSKKYNHKNRDRKGGHQPSDISFDFGYITWTMKGKRYAKSYTVREQRRIGKKQIKEGLDHWYIDQELIEEINDDYQYDGSYEEYLDIQEKESESYDDFWDIIETNFTDYDYADDFYYYYGDDDYY